MDRQCVPRQRLRVDKSSFALGLAREAVIFMSTSSGLKRWKRRARCTHCCDEPERLHTAIADLY